MRGINRINKYLKLFNQEAGEYLNLIGDDKKNYPPINGFIKINDFDNGAISNVIEYSLKLSDFIINQLDICLSVDLFLDFTLETYYDKVRLEGENDEDYYNRAKDKIFDSKVSNLSIKKALFGYGDDIQIVDGIGGDSAYYGISYYENTQNFDIDGENIVRKASFSIEGGRAYFFRVLMSNVLPSNYKTIVQIINEYKAAGVNYLVELEEFFSDTIAFYNTSFYEYNFSNLDVNPVVTAGFRGT